MSEVVAKLAATGIDAIRAELIFREVAPAGDLDAAAKRVRRGSPSDSAAVTR